jgi:hypothetical protein
VRKPPHRRNSPPAPYKHAHATDAAEVNGRQCHHYSSYLAAAAPIRSHCVVAETIGRLTFYARDYFGVLSGIGSSTDLVSGRKKLAHNLRRPRSGIYLIDVGNDGRRFS